MCTGSTTLYLLFYHMTDELKFLTNIKKKDHSVVVNTKRRYMSSPIPPLRCPNSVNRSKPLWFRHSVNDFSFWSVSLASYIALQPTGEQWWAPTVCNFPPVAHNHCWRNSTLELAHLPSSKPLVVQERSEDVSSQYEAGKPSGNEMWRRRE